MMNVSVIMATWNNAERLKKTLSGFCQIRNSDVDEWEMIVVDNNSSDNSGNVIKSFISSIPLQYKYEAQQGNSLARNRGIKASRGELLIFIDDDITVSENFLDVYWRAYRKYGEKFFFGGPVCSDYEGGGPPIALRPYLPKSIGGFDLGEHELILDSKDYFIGPNWACPKQKILESGLFDTGLGLGDKGKVSGIGEETELMGRLISLGLKPVYLPDAKVFHYVPKVKYSLKHMLSRKERIGFCAGQEERKNKKYPLLFGIPRWVCGELLRKSMALRPFDRVDAVKNLIEIAFLFGYRRGWLKDRRSGDNEDINFISDV